MFAPTNSETVTVASNTGAHAAGVAPRAAVCATMVKIHAAGIANRSARREQRVPAAAHKTAVAQSSIARKSVFRKILALSGICDRMNDHQASKMSVGAVAA